MNKDDSERIARALVAAGHTPVSHPDRASFVILNGCSVRDNSDRKTFGRIGALGARKQREPSLQVALTGCTARATAAELAPHRPKLDLIFDNSRVDDLLEHMASPTGAGSGRLGGLRAPGSTRVRQPDPLRDCHLRMLQALHVLHSAIPPRGRAQPSATEEIEAEMRTKAAEGAVEITLLGQIVNRYGRDRDDDLDLAGLLRRLDRQAIVPRLRFLTAHPRHFDRALAEAMAECETVLEEINLPVQSGNDEVLRRMGRGYNRAWYLDMIAMLRDTVPGVAISTDVIVGFPGETEEQFRSTLELMEEVRFDVVHIAAFSPRIGTVADRWGDDIDSAVKLERLHRCESLQKGLSESINAGLVGSMQQVLVEQLQPARTAGAGPRWMGRTRSNKLVFAPGDAPLAPSQIVDMKITDATAWSLRGAPVTTT